MSDILQLKDVSKSFSAGKIRAVRNVTLGIRRGAVTALIGPNGAGKTTLFNLICGYVRPEKGQILYRPSLARRGKNLIGLEPWRIARLRVGRLFQDLHTFERMTVLENVLSGCLQRAEDNLLRAVLRRRSAKVEESENISRAFDLLEFVGLQNEAYRLGGELSYGQQKLLSIARLMATDPELILLDEPTAGLSPSLVESMRRLINQLVRGEDLKTQERRTVVIIEHNLSFFDELADWCCLMNDGEVTRARWTETVAYRLGGRLPNLGNKW